MWLQLRRVALGLVLSLCAVSPLPAETRTELEGRTGVYADDDQTTVTTAIASGKVRTLDVLRLGGHYLVDVVSSASVDVVSAATERWRETRHEGLLSAGLDDDTADVSASYRRSSENDWDSHTISLGAGRDFLSHNLGFDLGLSYTYNRVGRADDPNFERKLQVFGGSLSTVVVASKKDLWSLTYSLSLLDGYQASPYRFARFDADVAGLVSGPEVVPERRVRHALGARHNRHLFRDSALRSHARLYVDDWGVQSVTLGSEYVHGLGVWEPAVFARGYVQTKASFYEDGYTERRRYMTADRELSPFFDVFFGAKARYRPLQGKSLRDFHAELKLTAFVFVFEDFARLPERRGLIAELGLGGAF